MAESHAISRRAGVERPLWFRVFVSSLEGWTLGIIAGIGLIVLAESLGMREMQTPLVAGVALGVSAWQYRALRPVLAGLGARWIGVSCAGLSIPFVIADVATLARRQMNYDLVILVLTGGAITSILQWSMLRTVVGRSDAWLVASPAGYLAVVSALWLNDGVLPRTVGVVGALQYVAVILMGAALFGLFTGMAASRFEAQR